ncbi:hypothetical protein B6U99_03020 [Candidatus Geothermarchaeota archaeon ex4572_27]|nr:MAG: hypothetical protein B6U99_03020 [Candidatus Geothermarchaeota archaeon ex4572_27]
MSGRSSECVAVVNTGFRSPRPDIIVPPSVARTLGIYPPPEDALEVEADTGGGPVIVYLIPEILEVKVLAGDRESKTIVCNAVVNPLESEVLISDKLTEELGVQILYPSRGIWRFADDPPGVERRSVARNSFG